MSLAKSKLFGVKNTHPLQKYVEKGILVPIDIAYAQLKKPKATLREQAVEAALFASFRLGHLCLEKQLFDDPEFTKLLPEGRFYLPKCLEIEDQIVAQVKRLCSSKKEVTYFPSNPSLTDEQTQALENTLTSPFTLISGGPGTGKTYTASAIIECLKGKTIITAPTGKAVAHLQSQVKSPVAAGTLHSLLKEEEPLNADLVIVDESSMIPPAVFAKLLASISPNTTLILMGDVNQLPAVEGGSVFADLIASKLIPTTVLTKCLRSDRTEILSLANAILQEEVTDMINVDLGLQTNQYEMMYQKLWNYVKDKDFSRFRILSTLRKGPFGVDALNRFLFEKFAQKTKSYPILITRNDTRTSLMNGDTGIVIENEAHFKDRIFDLKEIPRFEYAYVLSVHKSQGSEYEEVLFLVPEGSENFGKEVLYTAVTRAKEFLAIDGSQGSIQAALRRSSKKISGICEKLQTNTLKIS